MSYRIICDEHVPPQTVTYLEKDGHTAVHVRDSIGLGTDDPEIAAYARAEGFAVLTNDADFLDQAHDDLTVLYYPVSEMHAFDLAAAIADVARYYDRQADLPGTVYL